MPLPLYGSGGRTLRTSAPVCPTCCLSIPLTITSVGVGTSQVIPAALPAAAALGGGGARDQAVGGGQARGAPPAEDARQAVLARVDAAAGLGDALEIGDHALAIAAELEVDHQRVVGALLLLVLLLLVELVGADDPVVADVALLLEQPGDLGLQA